MPLDPNWLDFAKQLPDARAKQSKNEKFSRLRGWMEECFCVNCGHSGGMVTRDLVPHIFYLCNDCADTHGRLPIPELPEALVRG